MKSSLHVLHQHLDQLRLDSATFLLQCSSPHVVFHESLKDFADWTSFLVFEIIVKLGKSRHYLNLITNHFTEF